MAFASNALAFAAPAGARTLAPIPLAALAAFRPSELYGFVAADGARIAGALLSLAPN